jgi:hypothetical protein
MPAFHFKLFSQENEDFSLEIEVKENQTFEEFHHSILKCTKLTSEKMASFHLCDEKWNKIDEISLSKEKVEGRKRKSKKILLMKKCRLRDFVDRETRFIYESDYLQSTSLFIEVIDIYPAKQKVEYPLCVHKEGELMVNDLGKQILMNQKEADELKSNLLQDFENILEDEYDEYDDY